MGSELLRVDGLKQHFPVREGLLQWITGHVKAVDGVSFHIDQGETLGLVGESGCGKSTIGKTLLRLIEPTEGAISYNGNDITQLWGSELRALRREMQIVFQDPYSSLNPRMTIQGIIEEGLVIHGMGNSTERLAKVKELLAKVGLDPSYIHRYPHEFSGGQRQRVSIARALALNPKFIVLDEPISALDVSIQSQIINLLIDLKHEFQLTYLFISHDLSVVEFISDRVAVMYLGKIVELATSKDIYANPLHPYTQMLLSAVPSMDPEKKSQPQIPKGELPNPRNPPPGCRFHPRCPLAKDICRIQEPPLVSYAGHFAACHVVAEEKAKGKEAPVAAKPTEL